MSASANLVFRILVIATALTVSSFSGTASAQTPTQPKASPPPRRQLPKPVGGTRGFEQYAGRDASARLAAGAATRDVNNSATPFYDDGEADYEAGKYKEAVDNFSQAVHLSPQWARAHYALALSLTEIAKLKEAIEEFKQVLRLNPSAELKVLSYYNMGNASADLGQYKEAIASYNEAIKLKPDLSKPHNNLGLAFAASNRIADAIAEFNQAVQLKPDYAEAHYNLGVAYLQSGQRQKAEEQQRALGKLKPELATKLDALIKK